MNTTPGPVCRIGRPNGLSDHVIGIIGIGHHRGVLALRAKIPEGVGFCRVVKGNGQSRHYLVLGIEQASGDDGA